jgi:hypothetical protein
MNIDQSAGFMHVMAVVFTLCVIWAIARRHDLLMAASFFAVMSGGVETGFIVGKMFDPLCGTHAWPLMGTGPVYWAVGLWNACSLVIFAPFAGYLAWRYLYPEAHRSLPQIA